MFYNSAISYLEYNFGFGIKVQKWEGVNKLPVFLGKGYDYAEMLLPGSSMLLMDCSRHKNRSVEIIKTHITGIRKQTGYNKEIIAVYTDASYYHIKRMISEKMSFIIPGKQIYIPALGTVFIEKQQSKYSSVTKDDVRMMSPTAQALFMELICTNNFDRTAQEFAKTLNVTAMSVSRAFSELEEMNIIYRDKGYYLSQYAFAETRKIQWDKAYNRLWSPIQKSVYTKEKSIGEELRNNLVISGESALSKISMLGAPRYKVYGITVKLFKKLADNISSQPFLDEGACGIELWWHEIPKQNGIVHPLGIALLMKDEPDERVKGEIEQIISEYNWED